MRVFHLIFRSRISMLAALSVVALIAALIWQVQHLFRTLAAPSTYQAPPNPSVVAGETDAAWQQEMILLGLATTTDPSATSSDVDPIEMIGPVVVAQLVGQYAGLVESGNYSTEAASAAAEDIASNIKAAVTYRTYTAAEIKTDADISHQRMMKYRSDLREALEPLLRNTRSELEIYAKFIETSDAQHLTELSAAAANYHEAAQNAAALVIPRDAMNYHIDILDAMEHFAATLERMTKHSDDVFASIALLRSYNEAEQDMFMSFDALGNYYGQKLP